MNSLELIDYIVWYATTRGEVLTPIRLVKFLYLADLYYARHTKGQTLTGWPWAFVHYGPFYGEALDAIKAAVAKGIIEAHPFQSRYDGEQHFVYRSPHKERPKALEILPLGVLGQLEGAIRKWGGNTPRLLHHVYFETEPMRGARPGYRLDFSKAVPVEMPSAIEMQRLSADEIGKARQAISRLKEKYLQGAAHSRAVDQRSVIDRIYYQAMESLEEQPIEGPVSGQAKLSVEPEDEE